MQVRSFRMWLVILVVVLGVLALALWLDLRHQTPSFTIVNFSMPTSASSRQHSDHADILVALKIKNPNNFYSINYNYMELTVEYAQGTLGKTDIPGFHQSKSKETVVSSHVQADVRQWEALLKEISNSLGREAKLKVELRTGITYQHLSSISKQTNLWYQGQFYVGSDGKISGKKKVKLCKGSC